jgi:prevent-host-death family protein
MQSVASRELRNRTRWLLDRVATGERITITVDGRPVAILSPLGERRRWMPRDMFIRNLLAHQADPALGRELDYLAPDTTDELPL